MPRSPLPALLLALLCSCSDTPPDDSPRWVRVARDANYTIYIDTGRIGLEEVLPRAGAIYSVWYRTDHAQPRMHDKTDETFNREVVRSFIRCDSLKFRVASVDMSMGNGRVIVQQRLTKTELMHQKWRDVERGTAEEIAARAACHFVTP